jgi:hypothetical protein
MLVRKPKERAAAAALLRDEYLQDASFTMDRPPLLPVLACAAKAGAFENHRLDAVDGNLDPLLGKLHAKFTGEHLPRVASNVMLKTWELGSEPSTTASTQFTTTASPAKPQDVAHHIGGDSPLPGSVDSSF